MMYLSGAISPKLYRDPIADRVGFLRTPAMGNRPPVGIAPWGADNGCFTQGARFVLARYLDWLVAQAPADRANCLFATAPDVVGDAEATLARSVPVLPLIRERGFKPALVGQDGMEQLPSLPWDLFDNFFIGGSTEWKLGAGAAGLAAEAKRRGKTVHMGRVNSRKRLRHAAAIGCSSVDGTYLAFGPDKNLPKLVSWMTELRTQPALDLGVAA